ncbi:MAG: VCBS repeat-containing protein [Flavobacteriaceae bacterium]|nr:VCBS repeat-containing protein [Flavobacteriaceae bacterium]
MKYLNLFLVLVMFSCAKEEPTPDPVKYTLTVTAGEGGNVSSTGGSYTLGSEVTITATPNSEYVFSGWSNGSTDNPIKLTINSNQTLTANFTKRKYALSITIEGSGTVTEEVISSGKDYDSGTVVRLTAVPSENWEFSGWTGAVASTELSIDLTISEAKSLIATFRDPYLPVSIYNYSIANPNEYKVMLQQTFTDHTGMFYFEKNGFEYIIIGGVSEAIANFINVETKEETPRSKAFVIHKENGQWSDPIPQEDHSKMWRVRNFDKNDDFFVLADANEIGGDWSKWGGDLVIGTPEGATVNWKVVNAVENRAYNHDTTIGDFNGDGIPDVLGTHFNFFISDGVNFSHKSDREMIELDGNYPFAFSAFDLDSDHLDEIIFADYGEPYLSDASNRIVVLKYNSDQSKYEQVFSLSSGSQFFDQDMGATSVEVADFNNDGIYDVLVAREGGPSTGSEGTTRSFELWKGLGNYQFEPFFSKIFNGYDYGFQEFEVFDANNDGFLDILLRPGTNGGNPTNLFHINANFDQGIKLNNSIWLNNGDGTFNSYQGKELISLERAFGAIPYKGLDNKLHYFGFWQTDNDYDYNNDIMNVRMFDLTIELD